MIIYLTSQHLLLHIVYRPLIRSLNSNQLSVPHCPAIVKIYWVVFYKITAVNFRSITQTVIYDDLQFLKQKKSSYTFFKISRSGSTFLVNSSMVFSDFTR